MGCGASTKQAERLVSLGVLQVDSRHASGALLVFWFLMVFGCFWYFDSFFACGGGGAFEGFLEIVFLVGFAFFTNKFLTFNRKELYTMN